MAEPDLISPSPDRLGQINRLASAARLVAGLAHEVNNTLQVVSGLVELLGDRTDLPPDAMVRIQRIGVQAEKATVAIKNVLGYTREMAPSTGQIDLVDLVEQVLALRAYQLGRSAIATRVEGSAQGRVRVRGDARALQQVVLNLVLNAEEALTGHPQRDLHVKVGKADGHAEIEVRDSGPGLSDDIQHRVFEPFFSTRSNERALGLGLPVARAIAERHRGRVILADPRPGTTTFVVELPTEA
jgi:signal transduction histidine kinase